MERTSLDAMKGRESSKVWVSLAIAEDELSVICIVPIRGKTDRDFIRAYTAVAHSVASTMHDAIEKIHDASAIGNLIEGALPVVLKETLESMAKAMEKEIDEEEAPELEPSDEGELLEKDDATT